MGGLEFRFASCPCGEMSFVASLAQGRVRPMGRPAGRLHPANGLSWYVPARTAPARQADGMVAAAWTVVPGRHSRPRPGLPGADDPPAVPRERHSRRAVEIQGASQVPFVVTCRACGDPVIVDEPDTAP